MLAEAVGEASTCWSNVEGAGEFDSESATNIVDNIIFELLGRSSDHSVTMLVTVVATGDGATSSIIRSEDRPPNWNGTAELLLLDVLNSSPGGKSPDRAIEDRHVMGGPDADVESLEAQLFPDAPQKDHLGQLAEKIAALILEDGNDPGDSAADLRRLKKLLAA